MYRQHREAFQQTKGTKKPLESNIDNVINQAQIKMKEMILQKQAIDEQTDELIGKENVLNEDINFVKNEISNKKQTLDSLTEKFNETNQNIKALETENKKVIKEANIQEAKYKEDINGINNELERIKNGTIPAEAAKVFEIKKACDAIDDLKKKNNLLSEKLYLLSRRLYTLEVSFFYFIYLIFFRLIIVMLLKLKI